MEIINETPFHLSALGGRLGYPGHSRTFLIKGTFKLNPDKAASPLEEQDYPSGDIYHADDDSQTGSLYYEADYALTKPKSDFIIAGHCHTPHQQAALSYPVIAKVGHTERRLVVFGERYWDGKKICAGKPFSSLPLKFEYSFGGPGFAANPLGMGHSSHIQPNIPHALPHIEHPQRLINQPEDVPAPAGFGVIPLTWPQRRAMLGRYDEDYLKNRWPWFGEGFRENFFNATLPENQIEGYFKGDEALSFTNLHPIHSQYQTALPGIRPRLFLRRINQEGRKVFDEVAINLDTLWVDVEKEKLVLLWRGWTEVHAQDETVLTVYVHQERCQDTFHDTAHYYQCLKQRQAEIEKKWQDEDTQIPDSEKTIEFNALSKDEGTVPFIKPAKTNEIAAAPEITPEFDAASLNAEVERLFDKLDLNNKSLPEEVQQQLKEQRELFLKQLESGDAKALSAQEMEKNEQQLRQVLAQLDIDIDSLPTPSDKAKKQQHALMYQLGMDQQDMALPQIDRLWSIIAALFPKIGLDPDDLSVFQREAEKLNLHEPAIPEDGTIPFKAALPSVKRIQKRLDQGESFENEDLSGLDLSGLRASNANFSGAKLVACKLNHADLSSAILTDADLGHAVLDHANLREADLRQCQLNNASLNNANLCHIKAEQADFSQAQLQQAQLHHAHLNEAIFADTHCDHADFNEASIQRADFYQASLQHAKFHKALLDESIFEKSNLTQADLSEAQARKSYFKEATMTNVIANHSDLQAADLSSAQIQNAQFISSNLKEAMLEQVQAHQATFQNADLTQLRAASAKFSEGVFIQTKAQDSNWQGANLQSCDFSYSNLENADFTEADAQQGCFHAANVKFGRFIATQLQHADMRQMNLFQGLLEGAQLQQCDFTGANLYGAEFLNAHFENTCFNNANIKMTKLAMEEFR